MESYWKKNQDQIDAVALCSLISQSMNLKVINLQLNPKNGNNDYASVLVWTFSLGVEVASISLMVRNLRFKLRNPYYKWMYDQILASNLQSSIHIIFHVTSSSSSSSDDVSSSASYTSKIAVSYKCRQVNRWAQL